MNTSAGCRRLPAPVGLGSAPCASAARLGRLNACSPRLATPRSSATLRERLPASTSRARAFLRRRRWHAAKAVAPPSVWFPNRLWIKGPKRDKKSKPKEPDPLGAAAFNATGSWFAISYPNAPAHVASNSVAPSSRGCCSGLLDRPAQDQRACRGGHAAPAVVERRSVEGSSFR